MSPAASIQDISLLRDQASTAKRLLRKRHLSLESQNEAAKLHLAASLRMGDWLRNRAVKAEGGQPYQNSTGRNLGLVENKPETYTSLGIDKRDASKMQRLWDWLRNCHEKAEGTRGIIQDGMDGVGGPVLRPPAESDPPETYASLGIDKRESPVESIQAAFPLSTFPNNRRNSAFSVPVADTSRPRRMPAK